MTCDTNKNNDNCQASPPTTITIPAISNPCCYDVVGAQNETIPIMEMPRRSWPRASRPWCQAGQRLTTSFQTGLPCLLFQAKVHIVVSHSSALLYLNPASQKRNEGRISLSAPNFYLTARLTNVRYIYPTSSAGVGRIKKLPLLIMPQLPTGNNNSNNGYDSDDDVEDFVHRGRQRVRRVWDGFVEFAFQGNVLEIAFGLM